VRAVLAIILTLLFFVAGCTLAADHGGCLFWLPAAFIVAVSVAAITAWVLLVEVLR
jgi:hypothetical protein